VGLDRPPRAEEAEEAFEQTRQHQEQPLLLELQRTRRVSEEEAQIDERALGVPPPLLPLLGQEEEQAERDEEEEEGAFTKV